MAVEAVLGEPVSGGRFPVKRENTGFPQIGPRNGYEGPVFLTINQIVRRNSLSKRTGNLFEITGNFTSVSGIAQSESRAQISNGTRSHALREPAQRVR